ncbi:pentapeptide repeat-containing protein [Hyphobacterium marinum]|uniref:Pentapeptide repeat-containing protein n=1 Tax=Hyphobacterium marinum TaxID=3116574 RepID=A0ABU7LYX1_9PROT|nr:pentapeptide repeat-containing protein [Hyphobacterium sp. Y6023]MEE2566757.1 pentapeptide repeat-containing protein [Hyphobacterium sp. Y6023]
MVTDHENYVQRRRGGRKLIAKFADWSGCTFQRRQLDEADFSGSNLTGSRFALTAFKFANYYCTDLTNADLRGANLYRADMRGTILRGADLYGANLDEADFRDALLIKSDKEGKFTAWNTGSQTGPTARKVDFRDCSMKRAKLSGARLQGADFSGADLTGSHLDGAVLEGAVFENTILVDIDMKRVRIAPESLKSCVMDPTPDARERAAKIRSLIEHAETWAAMNGKSGRLLELEDEDIRPIADAFSDRQIPMSKFTRVCAIGGDFSQSLNSCSQFIDCDLRGASFEHADIRGTVFKNCLLNGANFRGAEIGAVRVGANAVRRTGFESCKVVNVTFSPGIESKLGVSVEPDSLID